MQGRWRFNPLRARLSQDYPGGGNLSPRMTGDETEGRALAVKWDGRWNQVLQQSLSQAQFRSRSALNFPQLERREGRLWIPGERGGRATPTGSLCAQLVPRPFPAWGGPFQLWAGSNPHPPQGRRRRLQPGKAPSCRTLSIPVPSRIRSGASTARRPGLPRTEGHDSPKVAGQSLPRT